MKKSKAISFLLSLSILASMIIPGTLALPANADDTPEDPKKGMEISKTATPNENGTYTITLEAYATGEKISTEVTKDVPTDIVLVLDQSGSMTNSMNTYGFQEYTDKSNSDYYNLRHNGAENPNLYYKLQDGSYVTVSVEQTETGSKANYTECPANWLNINYWANSNNLYAKVGDGYQKVTLTRSGFADRDYTYTFKDGTTFKSSGYLVSPGDFGGRGPLYVLDGTTYEYRYTYSYTDKDGASHQIGTSDGANNQPTGFILYERYQDGTVTRLQALKNAVNGFSNAVAEKAAGKDGRLGTDDDVDHRIAVVGFSCSNTGNNDNYNDYQNTEVFIGSAQYKYGTAAEGQYQNALQSMKTTQGQNNVNASIGALAADGATYVNHGIEMANGILEANPVPEGEKRNRVVIVFTDGVPGYSNFEPGVANSAITQANATRNLGANVYAVGIFNGADATSAGNQTGNDTQKANWFMQNLSDNKGTPQTPSYYLSAADSNTLNNIFKQIADNIESGGSSTTLDENAVIRDIIAPQFQLPAGATANGITLETYKYTGENQWEKNTNAMGATATVNGDQVNVTGFDFSENWCGTETTNGTTTYRGNKLVISFPVVVKEGFLGGNDVYTNTSAGVYADDKATNPVLTFPRPQVNVPIKDVTVTATDKNVYLKGEVTADQLKDGATVKVGEDTKAVSLDLSKANENYDLEAWQTEYVDITVTVKDKDGNPISDKLENLTEDTTYTVEVTVAPKTNGSSASGTPATEKDGKGEGKINVFKPELTYKDSEVYYGDTAPTDFSANLVKTEWKHDETLDTTVTMIGTAPELQFEYKPESGVDASNKISTKKDIPVSVDVRVDGMGANESLNDFITFQHQDCNPACGWTTPNPNNGNPAFLLHVKTCTLTITKQGGAGDESYVFDVLKDGEKYSEVTVWGNGTETLVELPVGTYTIKEDTGWSWRFNPNPSYSENVNLSKDNTSGRITCTNTKNKNQWLNGFSEVVHNIFGTNH